MIVLALETATRDGSVALARDGSVLASARGDGGRPHATRLPGDALALLATAGLTLRDVDVFAVCLGPGAFTGLRVGIAAAQGLAFATGRPIVGISALDALGVAALEGREASAVAGVWMDAARGEVFAARYVLAPDEVLGVKSMGEPISAPPAEVAAEWTDAGADGVSVDRRGRVALSRARSVPVRSSRRRRYWRRWSRDSARWPLRRDRPARLTPCDRSTSDRRMRSWRGREGAALTRRGGRLAVLAAGERRAGATRRGGVAMRQVVIHYCPV